jgi:membrane associated rhomboid family serine protease
MMRITDTVKQLLIINVLFFIGSYLVGDSARDVLALHFPGSPNFKPWQFITYMFMHGGIMHILFNMFGLYSFGSLLEQMWGPKKFIFFYLSCGVGAALLHLGINYYEIQNTLEPISYLNLTNDTTHQLLNAPFKSGGVIDTELFTRSVVDILQRSGKTLGEGDLQIIFDSAVINQSTMLGASGAIYGIIVAFAFMFPEIPLMLMFVPIPIKAKYFVPGLLLMDLFLGLKGQSIFGFGDDGIAHFAHLGGALIGFIMMWYWKKNENNSRRWN